jgi:hypothetical protein
MRKIICDVCGTTMKHVSTIKSSKKYRMRRFECVCGFKQTIFADGYIDIELIPVQSIDVTNKLSKQEKQNRDDRRI